jgi:hypothetical protein
VGGALDRKSHAAIKAATLATNVPTELSTSLGSPPLLRRSLSRPASWDDATVTPMKPPVHPKIIKAAAMPTASNNEIPA